MNFYDLCYFLEIKLILIFEMSDDLMMEKEKEKFASDWALWDTWQEAKRDREAKEPQEAREDREAKRALEDQESQAEREARRDREAQEAKKRTEVWAEREVQSGLRRAAAAKVPTGIDPSRPSGGAEYNRFCLACKQAGDKAVADYLASKEAAKQALLQKARDEGGYG